MMRYRLFLAHYTTANAAARLQIISETADDISTAACALSAVLLVL